MRTIKEDLVYDLERRIPWLTRRMSNTFWLWELVNGDLTTGEVKSSEKEIIEHIDWTVVKSVQKGASLADAAVTIGRRIRQKYRLKSDIMASLYGGIFILEAFANQELIYTKRSFDRKARRKKHPPYRVFVKDKSKFTTFRQGINHEDNEEAPLKSPAPDWVGGYSQNFADDKKTLIRHGNKFALKEFTPEKHQLLFNALNKLQKTAYRINHQVFDIYDKCLQLKTGSPFKHDRTTDVRSRESMLMEAESVFELAKANLNNIFYHRYSCDFRGRIYPSTAYLNEQSSDNAKGLLMYDKATPIGENGAYFLAVHTANCIGEDKLSLGGRAQLIEENMEIIIGWADDPMTNRGWMAVDKPWSTLACAFEWKAINEWVASGARQEDYCSRLPIFIDGSNNGVQHLTALALDEESAYLVNLDKTEEGAIPGDIYMFIADKVWENLELLNQEVGEELRDQLPTLLEQIKDIRQRYDAGKTRKEKKMIYDNELLAWRTENRETIRAVWAAFWLLVEDKSIRRKCVKRPVMTLGYGVTRAGTREQLFDDTSDLSEELRYKEKMWVTPMGDLVYDTCYTELKGPAAMLNLFRSLAENANNEDEFLRWTVPVTNFPVVQAYDTPRKSQRSIDFLGERLQLTIQRYDDKKLSRKDQTSGAAPNIVHSLDAAHMAMTIVGVNFNTTMVHDSFGCHIGNMEHMFDAVRRTFVELYEEDPLVLLLTELNAMDLMPDRGKLDIGEIMESDFAFC